MKSKYFPNKLLVLATEILWLLHHRIEQLAYKKVNNKLDYLYKNGMFEEARILISDLETNTTTVKFDINLRIKEFNWNEKERK